MKNKKGFTLVELLGVITILAILALIAVPTIDAIITKNREKVYNTQIETIKNGLKTWGDGNALALPENNGEYVILSLGILKKAGFVDEDIKDPTTDACFSNNTVLTITRVGNGYSYHVDEESSKGGTSNDCETPLDEYFILLKGSKNIELDFYESYVEPGYAVIDASGNMINASLTVTIKDKDGNVVSSIDSTSAVQNTYTITYQYEDIVLERKVIYGKVVEYVFDYTGDVQQVNLPAGTWKLEVWGASGGHGNPSANIGGKGGYSYGTISLSQSTSLFIYVGEAGEHAIESNTFGNGGKAEASSDYNSGQGGGASDIRVGQDSLYARVIVAGGGGGGAGADETLFIGGYGGGLVSGSTTSNSQGAGDIVSSATITSAGSSTGSYEDSMLEGIFGEGGYYGGAGYRSGGGGGGGWYGGGAGSYGTAGSGGSGWVYTATNFNTWKSGNSTDANKWLLNSSYYLTNAATIAGNQAFVDPDGTTVIGHTGNGYARITRTS